MIAKKEIEALLRQKVELKTEFTNVRRGLLVSVNDDSVDKVAVKAGLDALADASKAVVENMLRLCEAVSEEGGDTVSIFREIDQVQSEFGAAVDKASDALAGTTRPSRARTGVNSPAAVARARKLQAVRQLLMDAGIGRNPDSLESRTSQSQTPSSQTPSRPLTPTEGQGNAGREIKVEKLQGAATALTLQAGGKETVTPGSAGFMADADRPSPANMYVPVSLSTSHKVPLDSYLPRSMNADAPNFQPVAMATCSSNLSAMPAVTTSNVFRSNTNVAATASDSLAVSQASVPVAMATHSVYDEEVVSARKSDYLPLPVSSVKLEAKPLEKFSTVAMATVTGPAPAQRPASILPAAASSALRPIVGAGHSTRQTSQQPSFSSRTQQPAYSSVSQQPSFSSRTQQPAYSSVSQQPSFSSRSQQPAYSSVSQQPAYSSVSQQPAYLSVSQQPAYSSVSQQANYLPMSQQPGHSWISHQPSYPSTVQQSGNQLTNQQSGYAPISQQPSYVSMSQQPNYLSSVPTYGPAHMPITSSNPGFAPPQLGNAPPAQVHNPLKHVKTLTIPMFEGNKRAYKAWKAAFMASIGSTAATDELKILHLHQYLKGEALESIINLGFSSTAYQVAWSRLDRKYGGERRELTIKLDDVDKFQPVKDSRPQELQKLAELLEVVIVSMKESGRAHELDEGTLYLKLQTKLSSSLLTQFQRWQYENNRPPHVETLLAFVTREAEFATTTSELVHGIPRSTTSKPQPGSDTKKLKTTLFGANKKADTVPTCTSQAATKCAICDGLPHPAWRCKEFKKSNVDERWRLAKKHKLCFRCLESGHFGRACPRDKACNVNGCTDTHNWLLHRIESEPAAKKQTGHATATISVPQEAERSVSSGGNGSSTEGGDQQTHFTNQPIKAVAAAISLRTLPVVLRHKGRKVVVNALLDDGSTQSYVNSSVAGELNLSAPIQKVLVSTLNGRVETLETMPVDCHIESLSGDYIAPFTAVTTNNVTGNLQPHDWSVGRGQYKHLADIDFPKLPRNKVELLIGLDHADLHSCLEEVHGQPSEPFARRTPLGWTCVGATSNSRSSRSFFCYTLFSQETKLEALVQQMWELETVSMSNTAEQAGLSRDEQQVVDKTMASLQYESGRYCVRIPWIARPPDSNNSYATAVRRLRTNEKRIQREPAVAAEYHSVLKKHEEKGYVSKVANCDDVKSGWYLPHFAVTRPDAVTTKVRVVFDAAATRRTTGV